MEDKVYQILAMLVIMIAAILYISKVVHEANEAVRMDKMVGTSENLKMVNGTAENYINNATIWPIIRACITYANDTHEVIICELE